MRTWFESSNRLRALVSPWPLALTVLLGIGAGPVEGIAQTPLPDFPITDGRVFASAYLDGTLYIGGDFSRVGPATGAFAAVSAVDGARVPSTTRVTGVVRAAVPDGVGGWYLGGDFLWVNGVSRKHLAHVYADGSLDPWDPSPSARVHALLLSGGTLFVAGEFLALSGLERHRLAAVDAATHAVTPWAPDLDGTAQCMTMVGSSLFVAGSFAQCDGQARPNIARFDASSGVLESWSSQLNGPVFCLAAQGTSLYIGGLFTVAGGQFRKNAAALGIADGLAKPWAPEPSGIIHAIAVSGTKVYLGGDFLNIQSQPRSSFAMVDGTLGVLGAYAPSIGGTVLSIVQGSNALYVGGDIRSWNVAALDTTTGTRLWEPGVSKPVRVIVPQGGEVYLGGDFATVGGAERNSLAAIDVASRSVTEWSPAFVGRVLAMAAGGGKVYIANDFDVNVTAIARAPGAATLWTKSVRNEVNSLVVADGKLWVCGGVLVFGVGVTRGGGAALDTTIGTPLPFNPHAFGSVLQLLPAGSTVYAAGGFNSIGGFPRKGLAALDATTGVATAWDPIAQGVGVQAMALDGSTLYISGPFQAIGAAAEPRAGLAGVDVVTAAATPFLADILGGVGCLAIAAGELYLGGSGRLAAVHLPSGAVSAWQADVDGSVITMATAAGTVFIGGAFGRVGADPMSSLAQLGDVATPTVVALLRAIVAPDRVELSWYGADLAGRRVTLERRRALGAWSNLSELFADGLGYVTYTDRAVVPGDDYGYRLVFGVTGSTEETRVHIPEPSDFSLFTPISSTGSGTLLSRFSLPDASPTRLELLDVSGRRLESFEVGSLGPGVHERTFGEAVALVPGVYFLRLIGAQRSRNARGIVLR